MRVRWLALFAAIGAACYPFVGGIDGDRFTCTVDDDCAGDGFVCVAGVCRDPRDLRIPDAGLQDAAVGDVDQDGGADAGLDASATDAAVDAGQDAAASDLAIPDLRTVDHSLSDAGASEAATPDTAATDLASPDVESDAGAVDAGTADLWFPDSAAEDAPAEDSAVVDAGSDASLDAGVDAGPCLADNTCTATTTSFCFSGRCAHLDVTELTSDLEQVRMPSLALVDGVRPAVAYYGYSPTAASRKLGYFEYDGNQWQGPATVDSVDEVGADPALAFAPGGRPWFSYRKDANDKIRLAYYDGFSYQASDIVGSGQNESDRAGLVIAQDGNQTVLVRDASDGLVVGMRRPAAPDAIPGASFDLLPSFVQNARWPALFAEAATGDTYATFVNSDRPFLGLVLPDLGLVSVSMAPVTNAGCQRLGLPNSYCNADRPVDLAFDSHGALHFCTQMKTGSSDYRLLYLWLAADGFHGAEVAADSDWDSYYEPGAACTIVVDALDVPHVFFTQTARKKLRHARVHDHVPQIVGNADGPDDNGHWPDAVVSDDGLLHMAWSRVLTRSSNTMSTSALQVARLVWED
ncbi:MAG: hypothetical protein ABIJ09_19230 [Pseudomonadota bacterium]